MNTALTVITSVLVFGFLIFIHEFGHYITARIFKVTINEFSIGMGPKLLWYESKKTKIKYAISMLPIGGYVAMAGENEESVDPNAFDKKPAWQRFIITAAGASVNIVAGFLAMIIFTSLIPYRTTTISRFADKELNNLDVSSYDSGLRVGDTILKIGGQSVKIYDEVNYEIMRRGHKPVDVTVIRDGEKIVIEDVVFPGTTDNGAAFGQMDFTTESIEKNVFNVLTSSFRRSCLIVRTCWESLFDLITGRYSFKMVSGPVEISVVIGSAINAGFTSVLYIVTLISINLGVMNLLPIPALDGGRLITVLIEMITKKRLPTKVEGMINFVGLIALLALSLIVTVKDVVNLFF